MWKKIKILFRILYFILINFIILFKIIYFNFKVRTFELKLRIVIIIIIRKLSRINTWVKSNKNKVGNKVKLKVILKWYFL